MPEPFSNNHPHYALLEYARDMHQYTLELWHELSKKLDGGDQQHPVPPELPSRPNQSDSHSDRTSDIDVESPQDVRAVAHICRV
ncbi:hypothetical protein C8Q77DRAFT_1159069 [Trametes polyzona]|nr:hypothetical protein C8Q77DRAFT_1159069 [Trametes polyzona]